MTRRPNKLDWWIYRLFVWCWNPIFLEKPWLLFGLKKAIDDWIKEFERDTHAQFTYDEWLSQADGRSGPLRNEIQDTQH